MARTTRMKTKAIGGGVAEVLVLVNHPMETGNRKDKKTGKKIPAHYIKNMTFKKNGKTFASAKLGAAVSKNPLVSVRVAARSGDKITVAWSDTAGERGNASSSV
jgi:sulfur-oxidizing protein SoxZ